MNIPSTNKRLYDFKSLADRHEILREPLTRVRFSLRRMVAATVSPHLIANHVQVLGEHLVGELLLPHKSCAGETMDENDRNAISDTATVCPDASAILRDDHAGGG